MASRLIYSWNYFNSISYLFEHKIYLMSVIVLHFNLNQFGLVKGSFRTAV